MKRSEIARSRRRQVAVGWLLIVWLFCTALAAQHYLLNAAH
jgi:hypothetical protein